MTLYADTVSAGRHSAKAIIAGMIIVNNCLMNLLLVRIDVARLSESDNVIRIRIVPSAE